MVHIRCVVLHAEIKAPKRMTNKKVSNIATINHSSKITSFSNTSQQSKNKNGVFLASGFQNQNNRTNTSKKKHVFFLSGVTEHQENTLRDIGAINHRNKGCICDLFE